MTRIRKNPLQMITAKFLIALIALFTLVSVPKHLSAELCTIDAVPAATLLIPYFEVDLPNNCSKSKFSQQVSVSNVAASPVLARVVLWTEWSIPVYGFNIYLEGYQSLSFDLLRLLCEGKGIGVNQSEEPNLDLTDDQIALHKAWFTGKPSPVTGRCASHQREGNKAVGYITIDNIQSSTSGFPTDGSSYVNNLSTGNVLIGDYYVIDKRVGGARKVCGRDSNCKRRYRDKVLNTRGLHGSKAVAIEADNGAFSPNDKTFYGRYVGADASDNREPLPSTWFVRYNQTKVKKKFDLIVWREGNTSGSPVDCESEPDWHPMGMSQIVAFDEAANVTELSTENAPLGTLQFHDESQVIKNAVGNLPFSHGIFYLNFNSLFTSNSAYSDPVGASWVITRRDGIIDDAGAHPLTSGCGGAAPSF